MTSSRGWRFGPIPKRLGAADEWNGSLVRPCCCPAEPQKPSRGGRRRRACVPWHGAARPRALGCAQLTSVTGCQANSSSGGALAGAITGGELGSSRWP